MMKRVSAMTREEARGVRYVLMDIDDTLTKDGKLLAESYSALWGLKEAGLCVIPITGRPAGWCDLIAREWPVDAVVGENGALAFWEDDRQRLHQEFHPAAVPNTHPLLQVIRDATLVEIPGLRLANDQWYRRFDIALDFAEEAPILSLDDASRACALAVDMGARGKVSSIHVNIWLGDYDKLSMTEQLLSAHFGWKGGPGQDVLFVGDSPNDEPMFARFPLACGVANVRRYEGLLRHWPAFVADKEHGLGFAEIAAALLDARR